ncbi:hypothetical protein SO802_024704 [Lithocarpus litseifolius]|uniref:TMV resistance protein N-like n=1 Tax=Lithocarpus litseifolius TaxID=425828 RepID=A0AAW2CA06_9ROSI
MVCTASTGRYGTVRPESEFITLKLSLLFPKDTNGLVGIDSRVEKLMSLLAIGSNDVLIIGIWGMRGIVKTTLARVVYDKVINEFEGCCFIANVKGGSEKCELLPLQQKLICEILREDSVNIRDDYDGVHMIKNRLCHKKVLLVLDSVNQFNQLEKLARDSKWFGLGSRVIITTRDEHLLTRHKVHGIYEAQELNDYEALHLFSLKAFNKYHPPEDYLDLSTSFVDYAKGLPLAIDVLGSFLYNKSKEEWEDALDMMKEHHKKEIIEILVIGFGGLEHTEHGCPQVGLGRFWTQPRLDPPTSGGGRRNPDSTRRKNQGGSGFGEENSHSTGRSRVLGAETRNRLIGASVRAKIGWRSGGLVEPIWSSPPVVTVEIVVGLIVVCAVHRRLTLLDLENCKSLRCLPSKFEMESLEILILSGCSKIKRILEFMGNMKRLSKLHLNAIAITKLPSSIEHLTNLASLHLRVCKNLLCLPSIICSFKSLKDINLSGCSKLDSVPGKLWNVESLEELDVSGIAFRELSFSVVALKNLQVLSFQGCKRPLPKLMNKFFPFNLMPRRILNPVSLLLPSLLGMCSLKRLDLRDCNLQKIPNDIGNLSSITELYLSEKHFSCLPESIVQLSKLKLIDLNNCTRLHLIATPDFTGAPNLEKLVFNGCIKLREVHPSIMVHRRLTLLDLENCKSLRCLPSKFEMESLEVLILSGCSKIKRIPEFMGNMKRLSKLHLNGIAVTKLPASIEHLTNLDSLHLRDCKNLVCLPSIICSFKSLKDINLAGCSKLDGLPEKLWHVESLEKLNASGITLREPPSSVVTLENLKVLSLRGCKGTPHKLRNNLFPLNLMPKRSLNPMSLLLSSLLGMRSLMCLDLGCCNLQIIPNDIGNLSSIIELNLSENHFSCLPESMVQLSKLNCIDLNNCTRLRSLSQLPSTISMSIKLEDSLNLIATPDVNGVPNLEKLDAKGCKNLIEIHPSIAVHKRLTHLNLEGCHNLNTLPSKFEIESLEIFILSGCSKIKRILEFMGNMISLSKLHLDRTVIIKLPSSIAHLTNLASLHLRDCKNLACLPSIICSFKSLKDVNLAGCLKLDNLPEDLWNLESLEELDVSGIALRELTSSIVLSRNLKRLSFRGCKESPPKLWNKLFSFNLMPRGSLNPISLLSPSLPGLCYLKNLDLSDCNLQTIPNDFGYLSSLICLNLSENTFDCLPESIIQLSKLTRIYLRNCTRLRSLPQFPSSTWMVDGFPNLKKLVFKGCINLCEVHPSILVHKRLTLLDLENCKSLSSLPSKFEMESLEILILSDCSKIKRILEFMTNMEHLLKLHLDGTAIMKLPPSIEHLTNVASLHLRDCKNLVCLPSIICSFKSLKDINLAGCSKLDSLLEKLWDVESLEMLDVSGIALREPPSAVVNLKNFKALSFQGCKGPSPKVWYKIFPFYLILRRSLNPVSLVLPSLLSMCYLKKLDLSDCNLQTIPNNIGNLSSITYLNLNENHFSYLPESLVQLSKLSEINLRNCTRLCSLPKLPSYLDKLKFITLNDSLNLIATPDFTGVPNLEKLIFNGCINLHEVHPSIMVLKRLTLLGLENCKRLRSLPGKFEMESLEILILSGCSKIKRIPEFMENMKCLSKLHLDGIAITKLPSSIEHLTNLASLHLRDCKNLLCLPSIICSFKSLKDINLAGCSKLDGLPEKLWNVESIEKLNVSGIALRDPPSSVVTLENLKELSFRGCKGPPPKLWNKLFPFKLTPRRSQNSVSLLLPSLLGIYSLTSLDLRDCSLQTITNDIGNLSSISYLNLSENHFSCLPESIVQLSKLKTIYLSNCTGLRSLPQLPSMIYHITADGCTSLETFPNGVKPYDLTQTHLFFLNCFKLADNQGQSDMFLRMLLTVHQEICKQSLRFSCMATFDIFIPGSEIPKWFSHQNVGVIVTAKVIHPYKNLNIQMPSRSSNMWIGIAVCVDFSSPNSLLSDKGEFLMELRFRWDLNQSLKVNKCGFRMVYEQDLEDIREMISVQSSNSICITPYEGLDVHNDFHNSTEGIKMKRSRDEYEGAGPSGEGSSNDVPHSKRIER